MRTLKGISSRDLRCLLRWLGLPLFLLVTTQVAAESSYPVSTGANPYKSTVQRQSGNIAISGYDTVAYFEEGRAVEGSEQFETEYADARWRFASQENLDIFLEDPDGYLPQYGGFCAVCMVEQDGLFDANPKFWAIVNGKLYLNYDGRHRSKFRLSSASYIEWADEVWAKLAPPMDPQEDVSQEFFPAAIGEWEGSLDMGGCSELQLYARVEGNVMSWTIRDDIWGQLHTLTIPLSQDGRLKGKTNQFGTGRGPLELDGQFINSRFEGTATMDATGGRCRGHWSLSMSASADSAEQTAFHSDGEWEGLIDFTGCSDYQMNAQIEGNIIHLTVQAKNLSLETATTTIEPDGRFFAETDQVSAYQGPMKLEGRVTSSSLEGTADQERYNGQLCGGSWSLTRSQAEIPSDGVWIGQTELRGPNTDCDNFELRGQLFAGALL